MSRFWILLLISSLISDGFNCMIFPRALAGGCRRRRGVRFRLQVRKWCGHRLQFALHRADRSRCRRPTMVAPPISSGSMSTVVSIFLPKRFSSAALSAASSLSSIGNALDDAAPARRHPRRPSVRRTIWRICGNRPIRSASTSTRTKLASLRVELVAARARGTATPCRRPTASGYRAPGAPSHP